MKKLFYPILLVFILLGCIGLQKKEVSGLVEIEGQNPVPLVELCGVTLATIESWKMVSENPVDGEGKGLLSRYRYIYRVYEHPEAPNSVYMVFYLMEPFERAERIGFITWQPGYGPQLHVVMDRYKNTDLWYYFDWEEFERQHPSDIKPDKYKDKGNV